MTCAYLSRVFRSPADYRYALLADSLRWPETAPRTLAPVSFASLLLRSATP